MAHSAGSAPDCGSKGALTRDVALYGDKAIDRSPCGHWHLRIAQPATKGRLKVGDEFWHESIIGLIFKGRVEAETTLGNRAAIGPSVAGWALQTGTNTIMIDDRDPFARGFVVK